MESNQPVFRLDLLGSPSLTDGHGSVPPALGWGKPLALLCLLAIRGDARRDEIVDLLWRDVAEDKARNAFRQALHRLRSALGEELLPQERERLRLVRSGRITIDLDRFDAAVAAGRLEEAILLYRGDFLENTPLDEPAFDTWAEQERMRLQARFRQVLEDGVRRAAAAGHWNDAIAHSRRLLAVAPFDTSAAHTAATTLVSAGRRIEAQDLLRRFASRLQAELGLPLPTELHSLLGRIERQAERPRPSNGSASASATASPADVVLSFVGREAELTQLLALWRTTTEDAGAFALIEGEFGIGKSRLVRELALHARSLGRVTVLTGRERAAGAQLPFGIFAEALRPLVRAPGIVGASKHLLAEAARLLPELRDSLELPPVHDVEDEAARVRFFEGIAALIDAAAYEQPLLLVLEDLQYIGASSLDLLSYLSARLAGSAVMFAVTVRSADATPATLSRIRALAIATQSDAPPHGARAIRLLLAELIAADTAAAIAPAVRQLRLSSTVAERIAQRSSGVPHQLAELLRRAAAGEDIGALPLRARDLVHERFMRLSSAQRRLFLVIALIGRPVSTRTVANAAHLSENAARESVSGLEAEGLVEFIDEGLLVASELPAGIALEAAGTASRAFLSAWIAESLTTEPGIAPAELARFFAAAGRTTQAFDHARRAAFDALALGAVSEAVVFFNAARTFAESAAQHAEIEGMLSGLGSGRRRLVSTARAPDPPVPIPSAPPEIVREVATVDAFWVRLFPNWRLLLGAALATLLVSMVVLWFTPAPIRPTTSGSATDTLVAAEGEPAHALRYVTGDVASGFALSAQLDRPRSEPAWLDSLDRAWVNPIPSPGGRYVALARVSATGSDVYVISADRRDTIALSVNSGDARPFGWSPDGRWLLATTARKTSGGAADSDLYAYRVDGARPRIAVDTTARRSIVEAAWAPDGSRIAWVARVGAERQLEVLISLADGRDVRNVSLHPADDHHIAWSGDGELLAFTSMRHGNAELYAVDLREDRLWRLTRDPAQDDRGQFSTDGRFIAFESTRGGSAGLYIMPGLGGDAQRVGGQLPLSVVNWRGGRSRFVDQIRVLADGEFDAGDTGSVRILALDAFGDSLAAHAASLEILDSSLAGVARVSEAGAEHWTIVARRPGLARVVGNLGGWRFDTAAIRVGRQPIVFLDGAHLDLTRWILLGDPLPAFSNDGDRSVVLNADREWESGLLSSSTVPLLSGLTLSVSLRAALDAGNDAAASVSVALVAPEDRDDLDRVAPQFLRYASFFWSADADRVVYSVGREVFTESTASLPGSALSVRLQVERDSTVSFFVGGTPRWRSTLRVITLRNESRAQVWIGGRATGTTVRVTAASLVLSSLVNNR